MTLIFILTWVVSLNLSAQTEINTYTDVVPPSPTAASLGTYGQVPVGMFTGTAQFNIPIYQLNSKKLSVPISLNYSTNGVKVDQIASWVGMGWSLNAGGVITRMVRDRADEKSTRVPFENIENQWDFDPVIMEAILLDPDNEEMDTEPDLYSYNFNGQSGKFIIDPDGYPRLIPYQDVKIEVIGTGVIRTFEITNKAGVKYYFGEKEQGTTENTAVEKTRSQNSEADGRDGLTDYYTAWYLTKIVHPTGDVISFKYTHHTAQYDSGVFQSYNSGVQTPNCSDCGGIGNFSTSTTEISVGMSYLTEINTDNILITFESSLRTGGIGFYAQYNLDAIKIIDKSNSIIGQIFNFNYDYSTNTVKRSLKSPLTTKRLFLSGLIETGTDITSPKEYSFSYNNINNLPVRLSFSQDHWGYYNGANNFDNFMHLSSYLSSYFFGFTGANREPNFNYAKYGTLSKITYPTGGTSEIDYEANEYWGKENIPSQTQTVPYSLDLTGSDEFKQKKMDIPDYQESVYFIAKLSCTNQQNNCDDEEVEASVKIRRAGTLIFSKNFDWEISGDDFSTQEFSQLVYDIESGELTIELEIHSPHCSDYKVETYFSYKIAQPGTDIYKNIETGGIRVKRILTKENSTATPKIERYFYGTLNDLNKSSARTPFIPNYHNVDSFETDCGPGPQGGGGSYIPDLHICTVHHLTSSSNNSLYNIGGSYIAYKSVVKSFGEYFENGGEYFEYIANRDTPGVIHNGGDIIASAAYSNTGWNAGTLLHKKTFKKNGSIGFTILKEEDFKYNYESEYDPNNDERYSDNLKAGVIRRSFTPYDWAASGSSFMVCNKDNTKSRTFLYYKCTTNHKHWGVDYAYGGKCMGYPWSLPNNIPIYYNPPCYGMVPENSNEEIIVQFPNRIGDFDIILYDVLTRWQYLKQKTTTIYDNEGLNPIKTTINYEYNNVNHAQVTKTTTTTSKGDSIIQKYYYPLDYDYANLTELQPLVYNDIKGAAIDIRQEINGKLISGQLAKYNDKGQVIEIYQAENELGTILPIDTLNPYSYGKRKLSIDYDIISGNINEYNIENDVSSVYIWGYKEQYPVAKVDNATHSQVVATLTSTELTNIKEGDYNDVTMRGVLNKIRTSLTDSQVTTYTYDPLIGVTSITDPRGYTTYYEYDDFNRLKMVKDAEGNIISKNEYNYATSPQN